MRLFVSLTEATGVTSISSKVEQEILKVHCEPHIKVNMTTVCHVYYNSETIFSPTKIERIERRERRGDTSSSSLYFHFRLAKDLFRQF